MADKLASYRDLPRIEQLKIDLVCLITKSVEVPLDWDTFILIAKEAKHFDKPEPQDKAQGA